MNSVDIDQTNFVSKCTMHVKGAKCDIKLDSNLKPLISVGSVISFGEMSTFPELPEPYLSD